jgi:hypothetical protein
MGIFVHQIEALRRYRWGAFYGSTGDEVGTFFFN